MIRQFTVLLREPNATGPGYGAVPASLASIPAHFRVVADGPADATYASLENPPADVRIVVFDAARLWAPSTLTIPVAPAWTYLPRMEADAGFAEACTRSFAVINCMVTVAAAEERRLRGAFLEQLAILRKLTGADPSVRAFRRNARGYVADVGVGPTSASMIGRVSPLAQDALQLHAVGVDHRLDVSMDAATSARPAAIRLSGADGLRQAMPIHQSSHRLTWLKIHAFLGGNVPASDLPTVNAVDAAAVARAFDAA
ncbi:hypothetical protein I6F35_17355 [Bradyrhizobium sp. BRP22]|uniref:hypothetical protein n=1 Tax=Bradyrhizobium sp. BRP22 TaxID=2793821 RepID=UPI001CD25862|nr:hypothetical protein [Bradyrhizobium sp. BRP22]MCA1454975.1 hypothetical protein [Bradyrhizobium sp. BRP22]